MKNEETGCSVQNGSRINEKLQYVTPTLKVYGKAEIITQGNGRGKKTDNSQFSCENNPSVCNS